MKLELGGSGVGVNGKYARGEGWVNIDIDPASNIQWDLDKVPWPIPDDSVDEVYSCHCMEHLDGPFKAFNELCRICTLGAPIEIRVPHPASHLAMVAGHKHVFSPVAAINIDVHFPEDFWRLPRRLKLVRIEYHPTFLLDEARRELPFLQGLSDEAVMKWIPGTCHECRFFYRCVSNEFYRP